MKKLLFVAAVFICMNVKSQVIIDGNDINKLDINYIEIVGTTGFLTTKVTIAVDYGQIKKVFDTPSIITDQSGKQQKFASMVDALNFLEKNGWQYVSNYIITSGNSGVYHFLLRKK